MIEKFHKSDVKFIAMRGKTFWKSIRDTKKPKLTHLLIEFI